MGTNHGGVNFGRRLPPIGGQYSTPINKQWAAIVDGADKAGMTVSAWFVQCALTVDPWPRKHRRLVLDERQQRRIARSVGASARNLGAEEADGAGDPEADLGALLAARLRGMARRGRREQALALLRRAFGDETAETVAAAFMPDALAAAAAAGSPEPDRAETPSEAPPRDRDEAPPGTPPQSDLFGAGDG